MALQVGATIELNNESGVIRLFEKDLAVIQIQGGRIINTSPEQLLKSYHQGKLKFVPKKFKLACSTATSAAQQAKVDRYNAYLKPLDCEPNPGSPVTLRRIITEVASHLGESEKARPSIATLNRWHRRWIAEKKRTLLLVIGINTERQSRIAEEVMSMMDAVIDELFLTLNGPNRARCYQAFKNRFQKAGYESKCPSKTTFYDRVKKLDPYEVIRARKGSVAARRDSRVAKDQFEPKFILERVEIDAVHPKVALVDENGNFIGYPIIFLAIDVFSRAIVGYSIVFKSGAESTEAVVECIKNLVKPKQKKDYSYLKNSWTMYGLPVELITDAGSAFVSSALNTYLTNLGISRITTETHQPWKKPYIERFNRRLRDQCLQGLPGYVSRLKDGVKVNISTKQMACLQENEFEQILVTYIVDEYHQTPHSGLDDNTPQAVWDEDAIFNPPQLPKDTLYLDAFAGTEVVRTIQAHKGVEFKGIRYNSFELSRLYHDLKKDKKKAAKVSIQINTNDISTCTVINPLTGELLLVSAVKKGIKPGTSLSVYKAQRESTRAEKIDHPPVTIFDNKIIENAIKRKKQNQKRSKAAPPAKPKPTSVNSEISLDTLDEMLGTPVSRSVKDAQQAASTFDGDSKKQDLPKFDIE